MADPKQGSPKVTAPDAFGGVQQLQLDTNRPLIQSESLFRFANMVALPSRGIYSDLLLWPLAIAVPSRLMWDFIAYGLIPFYAGCAVLLLLLVPLITAVCYVGNQLEKTHSTFAFYRLVQILAGFALAAL